MKTEPIELEKVKGLKGSVATFIRPSDNKRIYVFARDGEAVDAAIIRVMKRNGAEGRQYAKCS